MKQLDRLESLAQRLIEGSFNRLFQTRLSPHMARKWLLQLGERQLRLGEPVVRIGRAPDNDIVLDDPTLSNYHAQLRWRQGRYYLYPPDNFPTNQANIIVNHKSTIQHALALGDVIRLGNVTFVVRIEAAA